MEMARPMLRKVNHKGDADPCRSRDNRLARYRKGCRSVRCTTRVLEESRRTVAEECSTYMPSSLPKDQMVG